MVRVVLLDKRCRKIYLPILQQTSKMTSRCDLYETPFSIAQQPDFFEIETLPVASDVLVFLQQTLEPLAGKWLASVIPFANTIPALSGNILEVHFDKNDNNVDFAARLNASFDKKIITHVKPGDFLFPCVPDGFLSLFKQNGSYFDYGIENIWLEYDAPFAAPPALFFDIDRNKPFHPARVYDALVCITNGMKYRIEENVFPFLEQISRCGLHVVYYGLMFSRNNPSLRLTINGIGADNLTDALAALGWKGNTKALQRFTSMYLDKTQKLVLGVDVGNGLSPRIGIEIFDESQPAFINKLYCNRHINNEQLKTLAAWEQRFVLPSRLRKALSELHGRNVYELHTRINHFKFVLDNSETIKAKGYLYYCF